MAEITATVTAITKMVKRRMEAVPLNAIVGHPTLNSVRHLVNQLATFASHFATTKWGSKHGFLPLVLTETKMSLDPGVQNLEYGRIKWPKILNPKIEDNNKRRKLLHIQEEQNIHWQE